MKLITKAISDKLERTPFGTYDDTPGADIPVIVKFFNPTGSGTWYACEGERQPDGKWLFFGYVTGLAYDEWGYFSQSELETVRLPFGLSIERDMHFEGNIPELQS